MKDKLCTCEKCRDAIEASLSIIGGKWSVLILWNLYEGTKRFNELQRLMPGISPKTLSQRLQELESSGIVLRTLYPEVPLRVEYSLTAKGNELRDIFGALIQWSNH